MIWIDINNGEAIENKVIKGCVEIIKKSDFDGKLLKGAEYGVFKESDDTQIATMVTDENGYAKCPIDLTYGGYYLKEMKAPPHYYIDENIYHFFIGAEGEEYQTIHFDFTDTPKIGTLIPNYQETGLNEGKDNSTTSPETGDYSNLWLPIILLICSSSMLIVFNLKHRSNKKKKQ